MGIKLGIDVGATTCRAYYVDGAGKLVQAVLEQDDYALDSVMFFEDNGQIMVGNGARGVGFLEKECIAEYWKTFLGNADCLYQFRGRSFSPAALTALLLQAVIRKVEAGLAATEEIEGVVITCPSVFTDGARVSILRAAEQVTLGSGKKLPLLGLLDDPVAAALAYTQQYPECAEKTVLLYDLGGGSFDCALVRLGRNGNSWQIRLLTADGERHLGGQDWSLRLVDCAKGLLSQEMDCAQVDYEFRAHELEYAKTALSQRQMTNLHGWVNRERKRVQITREMFEEATEDLLDRTIAVLDRMLAHMKERGLEHEIDEIVLLGGASKMPQIQKCLERMFGKPVNRLEPDSVAKGAALAADGAQWNMESGFIRLRDGSVEITAPCPGSYGLLALRDGQEWIFNLVMRGMERPAQATRMFGTAADHMACIHLSVFQNESWEEMVPVEEGNEPHMTCRVMLSPNLPRATRIDITFRVNRNGILEIAACDPVSGAVFPVALERHSDAVDPVGMHEVKFARLE